MSVIIQGTPNTKSTGSVLNLAPGTWFYDRQGDVYLVAYDDLSQERRVICAGTHYPSFITAVPLGFCMIEGVLKCGTTLRITNPQNEKGE